MKINQDNLADVSIKVKNQRENDLAILFLSQIVGAKVPDTLQKGGDLYEFTREYPYLAVVEGFNKIDGHKYARAKTFTVARLGELLEFLLEPSDESVDVGNGYQAIVSADGVTVEGITFSHDGVLNLTNVVNKFKK